MAPAEDNRLEDPGGVHPDARLRVLIPCFGEEVAPRFEVARRFRFWIIEQGEVIRFQELVLDQPNGIRRVRFVRRTGANLVLCNGIQESYRRMLEGEGSLVIDGVVGTASDAIFGFLAGRITPESSDEELPERSSLRTADLMEWTSELFRGLGWDVRRSRQPGSYPVDLIAERSCPLCGRPVRVAVCCGAHSYRVDEEIRELHRVTSAGYHARVYVHQSMDVIARTCEDYGIELLDPSVFTGYRRRGAGVSDLHPLRGRINGHEKLNRSEQAE